MSELDEARKAFTLTERQKAIIWVSLLTVAGVVLAYLNTIGEPY